MSATRSRKEENEYTSYRKQLPAGICVFCEGHRQTVLKEYKHFKLVRNTFGYSLWDGQKVVDHLMFYPKKHIDAIGHFTDEMVLDMHGILREYEGNGYNVYARAPASQIKSVVHQHTHLIKTEGEPKRLIILSRKPYLRFTA